MFEERIAICGNGQHLFVAEELRPDWWRWNRFGIKEEGRFECIADEVNYIMTRNQLVPFTYHES